ncbi:MAG: HD domain-containing protein [Chitinophagaceae bacterium]|nr:MAG: HD domain-containing protein [Chitinophagaceae bacterium]
MYKSLISAAEHYVVSFFSQKIGKDFVFHSFEHTREVVLHTELIAGNYELSEEDHTAVVIAAWFHDTGYYAGLKKTHEDESRKLAGEFLRQHNAPQSLIEKVLGCITATKMPQSPTNLIEQIICDADLFHLGSKTFKEKNKLLRQEINNIEENSIGKKEWVNLNIEFLSRHRYFTEYAREMLEPVKQDHLQALVEKAGKKKKEEVVPPSVNEPELAMNPIDTIQEPTEPARKKEAEKKAKDMKSERGVVAMFKIMSESHNNLSQMADSKANIMISVNTIVLSIMVSVLLGKLQFYPEFIIPTVILVCVCLSAVVFAILATRPNISSGTFTREDIQNKQINLLFFGNFYNMELPDYDWAMQEMMKDKDYLYGSMIKDIYFLGVVLARKYKLLRISYSIFMYGLIASIIAFGITFIFGGE